MEEDSEVGALVMLTAAIYGHDQDLVKHNIHRAGSQLTKIANDSTIDPMSTMNVSIPDSMKLWVEQQANSGRYANASDYVRHLIRCDQERSAKIAHMQALVTEGIESGVGRRSMDELKSAARRQSRASTKSSR